jgi:CDP-diacylglycerol--glycerol-3-phosphate 3-phosphatidyltransferase
VTREEYFERWAALHGGLDPRTSIPVQAWLTVAYMMARPLAALRLSPNAVTLIGVLLSLVVPYLVVTDHLFAAGVLALAVGIVDNLDGAVAVLTGRSTNFGFVFDSVADRVGDTALLVGLGLASDSLWPAAAAAFVAFLQEYARARAGVVGFTEIGVISISERPTRVLVTGLFLVGASIAGSMWADIGSWVALVLSVVGFAQVLLAIRSRLDRPE